MNKKKTKSAKLLKIIPFRLIKNSGIEPSVFTTSRPEKILKLPPTNRIQSTIPYTESICTENSRQFLSSLTSTDKSVKLLANTSLSIFNKTQNTSISSTFGENMTRISSLRFSYVAPSKSLPPIQQKISEINEKPEKFYSLEKLLKKQEKEDKKEKENQNLKKQIGYWSILRCDGPGPMSCESAQTVMLDYQLVVCGGQSCVKHCDLKILDMRTRTWKAVKSTRGPQGRLGHSLVGYKHKLVLFGGWRNNDTLQRQTAGKMYYISLHKNQWEKCYCTGEFPSPRQYHAAAQLGRCMLIYGGIDYKSNSKDDLFIFDLKEKNWKMPEVTIISDPGPRSHSTLTPVFHQSLKNLYDYSLEKIPRLKEEFLLTNSAFYLFGGLKEARLPCNDLHALYMRGGKLIWSQVMTTGIPPCPRFSHTAHAIQSNLYIFGGRNDALGYEQCNLAELFMFNVAAFKWERVEVFGNVPEGRWAHGMNSYGSTLILFGGITYSKFMSADIYLCETNRSDVERKIEIDEAKLNKYNL